MKTQRRTEPNYFYTALEASLMVGQCVISEADIEGVPAGIKGYINRRFHIGGGAYELLIFFDNIEVRPLRLNRMRFERFFRIANDTENPIFLNSQEIV